MPWAGRLRVIASPASDAVTLALQEILAMPMAEKMQVISVSPTQIYAGNSNACVPRPISTLASSIEAVSSAQIHVPPTPVVPTLRISVCLSTVKQLEATN